MTSGEEVGDIEGCGGERVGEGEEQVQRGS